MKFRGDHRRRRSLLGVYRKMHIPDDPLFTRSITTPATRTDAAMRASAQANGFRVWKTRYANIGVLIAGISGSPRPRASPRSSARTFSSIRRRSAGIRRRRPSSGRRRSTRGARRSARTRSRTACSSPRRIAWGRRTSRAPGDSSSSATRSSPTHSAAWSPRQTELTTLVATCDPGLIEETRRNWPFLRDCRIDAYAPILSRYIGG